LRVVGEALTRCGRLAGALEMLDEHIKEHEANGTRGLQLGLAYEARARVAIASNDELSVRHYAALCAQEYKGSRNPTLSTKYKGLIREAESAGLAITTGMQQALGTGPFVTGQSGRGTLQGDHTLSSRLQGCIDRAERAREALRVLLESTGATGGFLFELQRGGLELLASVEEEAPMPALLQMLAERAIANLDPDDSATSMILAADDEPLTAVFKDESGRSYEPMVLTGDDHPVLLAALRYTTDERRPVRHEMLESMALALSDAEN
jgi:hypothetical protein